MTRSTERPVANVLQDIVGHLQEIGRSEFLLAKAEIKEEAAKASKPAATVAIGVLLALYAGAFLLLAIVYALATFMAAWAAAVLVSVVVGVAALILIQGGKEGLKQVRVPPKTIESVKENMEWTKDQIK